MEPRKSWAQYCKVRTVLLYMFKKAKPVCLTEIRYDAHDISETNVRVFIKQLISAGMVEISHTHLRNIYYKLTDLGMNECYPNTVPETDPLITIAKAITVVREQVLFNYTDVDIRSLHQQVDALLERVQQISKGRIDNG